MKKMMSLFAFVAMMGFAVSAFAAKEAAKETTVTGTMKCQKCSLKEADKCGAVVVAKEEGKEVKYYAAGPGAAALHTEICKADKEGASVTGVVSEKGGKKTITVAKAK
ncbi:hypothetical protein [Humisphaera borealis]|uniref:Uncharacterized protein n=1 Tax=Humisphaera borealis TaxID=2807512 RepID=A0A7M2WR77_9BACT|nr:hypothetical protein [Humisphaera borealis]QOV88065.1 hypothetical protein IPV69_17590 [Humisphaera borealis]